MASKAENIYQDLKRHISEGEYLPGVHLIENDIIVKYNVSRPTIREVFRRLVEDEIVEAIPNKGVRVRRLTVKELKDYFIVYEYLSGLSARLAAEKSTEELNEKLYKILQQYKEELVDDDFSLHTKFGDMVHKAIAQASDNQYLIKDLERITTVVNIFSLLAPVQNSSQIKNSLKAHEEIIFAIKNKNASLAEKIMRLHMREKVDLIDKFNPI